MCEFPKNIFSPVFLVPSVCFFDSGELSCNLNLVGV